MESEKEKKEQERPLLFCWKVWYSYTKKNQNTKDNYSNTLQEVASFDSVENLWRTYNNLVPIEYLPANCDFFIFKDYISPQWEDVKNQNGGRWIYDIAWDKSKHQVISQLTEQVWLKLVFSSIILLDTFTIL
jgi:translation initiation factor 4E